jgi:hypothetical protein
MAAALITPYNDLSASFRVVGDGKVLDDSGILLDVTSHLAQPEFFNGSRLIRVSQLNSPSLQLSSDGAAGAFSVAFIEPAPPAGCHGHEAEDSRPPTTPTIFGRVMWS